MLRFLRLEVIVADHAGTCYGVSNAIRLAFEGAGKHKDISILGDLVHNPHVTERLADAGVKRISHVSEASPGSALIIRAHGEPEDVFDFCKRNSIKVIDCTCPHVRRVQELAETLSGQGYKVVVVGDNGHPEVAGILARTKGAVVVPNPDEIQSELESFDRIGIVAQTTQENSNFNRIVSILDTPGRHLSVHNTICTATKNRQESAQGMSKRCDLMLVIGGKNSANTKRLYEICRKNTTTYWIASPDEIRNGWLKATRVGITAGASTPNDMIEKVKHMLEEKQS